MYAVKSNNFFTIKYYIINYLKKCPAPVSYIFYKFIALRPICQYISLSISNLDYSINCTNNFCSCGTSLIHL